MLQKLTFLLKHAELNITSFAIHHRKEMNYRNRVFTSHYMMSYHKSGFAKLKVGEEIYDMKPGTVIFIPPHLLHDQYKESDDEAVILWWHFTFKIEKTIDVLTLFEIPFIYTLKHAEQFEAVFEQFIQSSGMTNVLPVAILQKAKALELLYLLLDEALGHKTSLGVSDSSHSFLSILCRMIQHPERTLSLKSLAKEMHMNTTYISGRFKELFGQSPIQLQRRLKIERAKALLVSDQELSIALIAESLGFTEAAHFTRLFKRYTGVSPLQYRLLAPTIE